MFTMRDKLEGVLKTYCTNSEKIQLQTLMDTTMDWLYNEGYDGTKLMYTRKLDELKAIGGKIETRYNEETNRQAACDGLRRQIELCKSFLQTKDGVDNHSHITPEELSRIRVEAEAAESWLFDEMGKQAELASYEDPILTTETVAKKRQALFSVTNPIMTKPKPKAPVPESKENGPSAGDAKGAKGGDDSKGGSSGPVPMEQDIPPAAERTDSASEPMEQS